MSNASSQGAPESAPAGIVRSAIADLLERRSLDRSMARRAMEAILEGRATPAQIGAFLIALRMKGETVDEVTGFVEAMRAAAVPVSCSREPLVDLCGTGGDGSHTINISTAASIVAAASGAVVAKHGNRSASSQCGSADVLEALGVPIENAPERSAELLERHGFAFLFAPTHHPAMRFAGPPRRELGVRTVFNMLGPLCNPAGVKRQLVGVFDNGVRRILAEVLAALGCERAWVVYGRADGQPLDEISIAGTTSITEVDGGELRELQLAPEDAGLERARLEDLHGGDATFNAARLRAILGGEKGPQRDAVVLNAGAALVVAGLADGLRAGVERAAEAIDAGRARKLLEELSS